MTNLFDAPDEPVYKPSRRVRTAPGGEQTDIFGHDAPPARAAAAAPAFDEDAPIGGGARSRQTSAKQSQADSFFAGSEEPAFKPTRRVREGPGGASQLTNMFAPEEPIRASSGGVKHLVGAGRGAHPSASSFGNSFDETPIAPAKANSRAAPSDDGFSNDAPAYKPTRRVRENPGGESQMSHLWDSPSEPTAPAANRAPLPASGRGAHPSTSSLAMGGFEEERPLGGGANGKASHETMEDSFGGSGGATQYKPTRRVRENPGGTSSMSSVSGPCSSAALRRR